MTHAAPGAGALEIRAATADDVPLLLSFIREMAAFERLAVSANEESLRAALFGEAPAARALLAFAGGRPVGYATWFFSFTSMMGRRALWLDDLYLKPEARGHGFGLAMMEHLARIAAAHDCARLEWIVLDWNRRAIDFYRELGAEILEAWRLCRLDEAGIARLASRQGAGPAS